MVVAVVTVYGLEHVGVIVCNGQSRVSVRY